MKCNTDATKQRTKQANFKTFFFLNSVKTASVTYGCSPAKYNEK